MRALTVHQPFASEIVSGRKAVERRSWPTNYRGRLAIHASKKPVHQFLPNGVIVGVVELVAVLPPGDSEAFYEWILERPRKLMTPLAARGRRGLWTPEERTVKALAALTSTVSGT